MQSLGLQTTTTFVTGRRVSRFINKEFIEDVVISEAITVSVIFYLVVLLHDKVDANAAPSLVPLFHVSIALQIALKLRGLAGIACGVHYGPLYVEMLLLNAAVLVGKNNTCACLVKISFSSFST
uniref:Putative phosphatidylinositol n-acetylglucosaminyltransferase subunit h n=1 Tax=Ixodes ricinus TaxID=34613 RepID=A0A147BEN5_IXORI